MFFNLYSLLSYLFSGQYPVVSNQSGGNESEGVQWAKFKVQRMILKHFMFIAAGDSSFMLCALFFML